MGDLDNRFVKINFALGNRRHAIAQK